MDYSLFPKGKSQIGTGSSPGAGHPERDRAKAHSVSYPRDHTPNSPATLENIRRKTSEQKHPMAGRGVHEGAKFIVLVDVQGGAASPQSGLDPARGIPFPIPTLTTPDGTTQKPPPTQPGMPPIRGTPYKILETGPAKGPTPRTTPILQGTFHVKGPEVGGGPWRGLSTLRC